MTAAPLIAFYGDDFTGSTDVMEALSSNGVETVLFTHWPDAAMTARFSHCRGVGLAGMSRSKPPEWMRLELPAVFRWLRESGAKIAHYKVCSTFDSAPHLGSIGAAIEIGIEVFGQTATAIVVGAPQLRRYTAFATLFAGYSGDTYRIDRHPVMSQHPATPMREPDLRRHLALQTAKRIGLVPLPALLDGDGERALAQALEAGAEAILIDVADLSSQARAGDLLWRNRSRLGTLLFGSSGVEYALLHSWRADGLLADPMAPAHLPPRERIAVASGSCSPTTDLQIRTAEQAGFAPIGISFRAVASGDGAQRAIDDATSAASAALAHGRSPIVFTARGPGGLVELPPEFRKGADERVGSALGKILNRLRGEHGLERLVIAGGDTSSHAVRELGIRALTMRHPIPDTPGSPVCEAHFSTPDEGQLEIVLKGGQIGSPNFFDKIRSGRVLD